MSFPVCFAINLIHLQLIYSHIFIYGHLQMLNRNFLITNHVNKQ